MPRNAWRAGVAPVMVALIVLAACSNAGQVSSPPATPTPSASASASTEPGINVSGLTGRITFSRAGGTYGDETIFVMNADGTGEQLLTTLGGGAEARLRRDGGRLLFATGGPDDRLTIVTMKLDGSDTVRLPISEPNINLGNGQWSPDGSQILAQGFAEPDPDLLGGLYLMNAQDGSGLHRITTACEVPGDFSPDGTRILCAHGDPVQLFVVNVDGSGAQQITPAGTDVMCCTFRWSPDGTRILFFGSGQQNGSLWLVNPDGTNLTELYRDPLGRYAISPSWSPDGSMILFSLDPTPDSFAHPANTLYVMFADGTGLTPLITSNDFKRNPDWAEVAQR